MARRGGIEVRLGEEEAAFLRQLPLLLADVGSPSDDPAAARLDVPVYLDDPDSEEELKRWIEPELAASRAADRSSFLTLVDAAADGTIASPLEAESFLRVLVEGRLALAARLGVDVEEDYQGLKEADAGALDYLAALQLLLIEQLDRL